MVENMRKNKITITFEAIGDKEEIKSNIEKYIVKEVFNSIWNVSNFNAKVEGE